MERPSRTLHPTLSMLALVTIGVLSTSVLVTLPILAAAMSRQVGGGEASLGYLASADMFGSAVASLAVISLVARGNWRRLVAAALVFVIAANLASAFFIEFWPLLLIRFVVGLCNGVSLSVVFVGLCHTRSPDRSFGIFVFAQLVLQAALLPLFSQMLEGHGVVSLYWLLAALPLPALLLVRWIPTSIPAASEQTAKTATTINLPIWARATVIGLGIYFIAPAMIWAFFEPMGRQFDLDPATIGAALGLSALAGIAGAGTTLLIGDQIPRIALLASGIGLSIISLVPLYTSTGHLPFLFVACVFNFAWNFTFPYLMGVIAHYDSAGETAIQSLAAQLFGLAIGPVVGAMLISDGHGYGHIVTAALLIFTASLVFFIRSEQVAQRARRNRGATR